VVHKRHHSALNYFCTCDKSHPMKIALIFLRPSFPSHIAIKDVVYRQCEKREEIPASAMLKVARSAREI
jgi:hypothetical protein